MATLVLTAVGALVGGPIGAAAGAAIGQTIDREVLFKPKGRQGPRLTELAIQTSSYGTPLPMVFGTLRVAGSVIWATDLIEHRARGGGGKGQPRTTNYSYSASVAVALSAREIRGVGRVWADGKLLRGAAGDMKSAGQMRIHTGREDQPVDPLIAALEGAAPAHRGVAYAVFEDLALGDFGNRIPSLTFEVIADAGAVAIGAIAQVLAPDILKHADPLPEVEGFSAYGDSRRGVIETLAEAAGAWFQPVPHGLAMRGGAAPARSIDARDAVDRRTIAPIDAVPRSVSVAHYDPARDWLAGVQTADRPGAGRRAERIELPASLGADAARTLAEAMLRRHETARTARAIRLDGHHADIVPGEIIAIVGEGARWRCRRTTIDADGVTIDIEAVPAPAVAPFGAAGRPAAAIDLVIGGTLLRIFELAGTDQIVSGELRMAVVAAGDAPGWRRAALTVSIDGGASWTDAGVTAAPGVIGMTATAIGTGPSSLIDRARSIEVKVAHGGMLLANATAAAIDRGANVAMLGGELIQFERATPVALNRWRLSGLWRGRRGTAAIAHPAGTAFTMIEEGRIASLTLPMTAIGSTVRMIAAGTGDAADGVEAAVAVSGVSLVPPSPVHLRRVGRRLTWVRRSRAGWHWTDGGEVPLGEETELYRATVIGGGTTRILETSTAELLLDADETATGTIVEIRQIGTHGASAATRITM